MNKYSKHIALLILVVITIVPFFHKITNDMPPEWFIEKFKDSILNNVPFGLEVSFYIIVMLEILAPAVLLIGWRKLLLKKDYQNVLAKGFLLYYILFLILTFGSFLVQDYNNGFKDFIYFVGVVMIEQFFFKSDQAPEAFDKLDKE